MNLNDAHYLLNHLSQRHTHHPSGNRDLHNTIKEKESIHNDKYIRDIGIKLNQVQLYKNNTSVTQ